MHQKMMWYQSSFFGMLLNVLKCLNPRRGFHVLKMRLEPLHSGVSFPFCVVHDAFSSILIIFGKSISKQVFVFAKRKARAPFKKSCLATVDTGGKSLVLLAKSFLLG
jgi:hypothetical protein